jgi:hypothetical protein
MYRDDREQAGAWTLPRCLLILSIFEAPTANTRKPRRLIGARGDGEKLRLHENKPVLGAYRGSAQKRSD